MNMKESELKRRLEANTGKKVLGFNYGDDGSIEVEVAGNDYQVDTARYNGTQHDKDATKGEIRAAAEYALTSGIQNLNFRADGDRSSPVHASGLDESDEKYVSADPAISEDGPQSVVEVDKDATGGYSVSSYKESDRAKEENISLMAGFHADLEREPVEAEYADGERAEVDRQDVTKAEAENEDTKEVESAPQAAKTEEVEKSDVQKDEEK